MEGDIGKRNTFKLQGTHIIYICTCIAYIANLSTVWCLTQTWPYTIALLHYAKGISHAVLGDVTSAELCFQSLLTSIAEVPDNRVMHNNTCQNMLKVAVEMLRGEIAYRKGTLLICVLRQSFFLIISGGVVLVFEPHRACSNLLCVTCYMLHVGRIVRFRV